MKSLLLPCPRGAVFEVRHVGSSFGEREYLHRSLWVSVDRAFNRLPGLRGDSRGRQQYFKWNQGYPVDVCVCVCLCVCARACVLTVNNQSANSESSVCVQQSLNSEHFKLKNRSTQLQVSVYPVLSPPLLSIPPPLHPHTPVFFNLRGV